MSDEVFQVGAPGVNVEALVAGIRATVARKTEQGLYGDLRVARAERTNLANLSAGDFDAYYLETLRDAVFVDINDFDIQERRSFCPRLMIGFKRAIWKVLKFYTYRLWSQQNEINGLLLSATETTDRKYRDKIQELETRLARLEK
jgi:hypothetical protein